MSAIAAIIRFHEQPVTSSEVTALLFPMAAQSHAGREDWSNHSVGLGFQSFGALPLGSLSGGIYTAPTGESTLTASARLDNRADLISRLRLSPSAANTEIILSAYLEWGRDCPRWLIGDFSFVIWDDRAKILFCACDHLGIKPLYYARTAKSFVIASEIDSLLHLPDTPFSLNTALIDDYLSAPGMPSGEQTFFAGIRRLPASHSLTLTHGDMVLSEYWALDSAREVVFKTDADYDAAFLEILGEAVACRVRDAHTVGAMLSGGLDSSSVVAIAAPILANAGNARLQTYYLASSTPSCDERPFVDAMCAAVSVQHHERPYVSPMTGVERWLHPRSRLPLALFVGATMDLFESARANGVQVMLTGVDGDNTIGHGRAYLTELAASGRWHELQTEITGLCQHFGGTPSGYLGRYVLPRLGVHLVEGEWRAYASGVAALASRWQIPRRRLLWRYGLRPLLASMRHSADHDLPRTARAEQIAGLRSGALHWAFAEYTHMANRTGIEVRHPFSDRRLIEFCVALPPTQKIRQGWTRLILRRAMTALMPPQVCWRSGKQGYLDHVLDRVQNDDQPSIQSALAQRTILENHLGWDALQARLTSFSANPNIHDALFLVRAARLNLWLVAQGQTL